MKFLSPALMLGLILVFSATLAACGGGGDSDVSGASVDEEGVFEFQLAWITRGTDAFELTEEWVERLRVRSNGRLDITLISYPELDIDGPDTLRLMEDGTLPFTELYSGYIGGDLPFADMNNLSGLYDDTDTQLAAINAVKTEMANAIGRHNGVIISYGYYPNNYVFSKRPLNSLEDFKGLKTRTHSTVLDDLLSGLGADGIFLPLSEVYPALDRGVMDAGITVTDAAHAQKWFEVTEYMVGPIVAYLQTWVTMNKDMFDGLPEDLQQLLLEEGEWREEENLRRTIAQTEANVEKNVASGLVLSDWPEDVKPVLRETAIEIILPNWIKRAGGPESEAVKIFSEKVAPLVGVTVNLDGTAERR